MLYVYPVPIVHHYGQVHRVPVTLTGKAVLPTESFFIWQLCSRFMLRSKAVSPPRPMPYIFSNVQGLVLRFLHTCSGTLAPDYPLQGLVLVPKRVYLGPSQPQSVLTVQTVSSITPLLLKPGPVSGPGNSAAVPGGLGGSDCQDRTCGSTNPLTSYLF